MDRSQSGHPDHRRRGQHPGTAHRIRRPCASGRHRTTDRIRGFYSDRNTGTIAYMDDWNRVTEQRIEEALENGELDVPALHGKPLDLTENPYVPEDQRLAFKLLKDNGLSPAWITDGKDIRELIDKALVSLRRSHTR